MEIITNKYKEVFLNKKQSCLGAAYWSPYWSPSFSLTTYCFKSIAFTTEESKSMMLLWN